MTADDREKLHPAASPGAGPATSAVFIEQSRARRYYSPMTILRVFITLATFALAACSSSIPTSKDLQHYYVEAEKQAQRDIDRLAIRRNRGEISSEEYQRRETAIIDSIPRRATQMAWARHELTQSQLRGMSIPTPDVPIAINAPGRGAGTGSFYHQAGQTGPGNNAVGAGVLRGYQPATVGIRPQSAVGNDTYQGL